MNVESLEESAKKREREWLLDQEIPISIHQLHQCLLRCHNLFKLPAKAPLPNQANSLPAVSVVAPTTSHHPGKYVFSSSQSMDGIKAFVTLDGSHITAAELKVKLPSSKPNSLPVNYSLRENCQWPLSQLQTAGQCVQRAVGHLSDAAYLLQTSAHTSSTTVPSLLQQLEVLLSKSVDSLMIPDHLSLAELSRLGYQTNLRPALPEDTMIAFYIHCSRLVLTIYSVSPSSSTSKQTSRASVRAYVGSLFDRAGHRWEVTNVTGVEVSVPWVAEVLCLLTTAQQLCQQLKEKMALLSPAHSVNER